MTQTPTDLTIKIGKSIMKEYVEFEDWKHVAETIGWVHCHDDIVVCDDPDTDELLGEFDSTTNKGWIKQ
jgi:hypothetical protein